VVAPVIAPFSIAAFFDRRCAILAFVAAVSGMARRIWGMTID